MSIMNQTNISKVYCAEVLVETEDSETLQLYVRAISEPLRAKAITRIEDEWFKVLDVTILD